MKRQIFIQSEFFEDIAVVEVEHDVALAKLRELLKAMLPKDVLHEDIHIFFEDQDEDEAEAFQALKEIPEGLRLHLHRLKGIDVSVNYAGRYVQRTLRPSATVERVKRWSTKELGIAASDAAELMLQVSGTNNRPDLDTHIGSLARGKKNLSFDLVPSPRVNG